MVRTYRFPPFCRPTFQGTWVDLLISLLIFSNSCYNVTRSFRRYCKGGCSSLYLPGNYGLCLAEQFQLHPYSSAIGSALRLINQYDGHFQKFEVPVSKYQQLQPVFYRSDSHGQAYSIFGPTSTITSRS